MSIDLRTRHGWEDLKRILDDRLSEVLAICGLEMPRRNGWTLLDDPRGDGRDCFGICIRADGLAWKKFNGSEKGRALELIAYCHGWYHLDKRGALPAANLVIARLGLGSISQEQLEKDRALAAQKRAAATLDGDRERERKAEAAFATFVNAKPLLGSVAEHYLRGARGVDLRGAPFIGPRGGMLAPGSLRFAPAHRFTIRDGKGRGTGQFAAPAIVACCTDIRDGQIRAVHQTWLRGDGSDKADIPDASDGKQQKPRKVLGDFAGLVIPLWRGDGHLSVKEACANGLLQTLVLTEGVEDGLSAVLAGPQHRVWAMISLSNMANVAGRLPECIDSVIVHRQNDWDKPDAVAAFERGLSALRATGRAVAEVAAVSGKDLNDTLRGAA
jgi:hypothetical protein